MMNFRQIKLNLIEILSDANALLDPAFQFNVVQAQQQNQSSTEVNIQKKVTVFYSNTDIPTNKGASVGTSQTEPTYRVLLQVSAKGTQSDVNDPKTIVSAELIADNLIDEFIEQIYQILMNATKQDLGMEIGQVNARYIKAIDKSVINKNGDMATLQAQMDLTCNTPEDISGDLGIPGTINSIDMELDNDPVAETGIQVGV